eukprot:XP_020404544.1 uncharacterized protein LOC103646851 [Zea mays]
MEDHGSHPLLQSSPAAAGGATLAYAWGYYQQQQPSAPFGEHQADSGEQQLDLTTAPELRRALVRALAELHASRAAHQAELRRVESEAARLAALVSSAAAERDELRRQCHSLLLLLHHQNAPDADDAELEMALARRLPEKGRLVEAVVSAGPLLQTLLLAGPLPRWRHPPPPAPADIPPFHPGGRHSPSRPATRPTPSRRPRRGRRLPRATAAVGLRRRWRRMRFLLFT